MSRNLYKLTLALTCDAVFFTKDRTTICPMKERQVLVVGKRLDLVRV